MVYLNARSGVERRCSAAWGGRSPLYWHGAGLEQPPGRWNPNPFTLHEALPVEAGTNG